MEKESSGFITIAVAGGRIGCPLSCSILNHSPEAAISVYPNPSPEEITIDLSKADNTVQEVKIYNAVRRIDFSQVLKVYALKK
jgi:hypothetical protein